MNKLSITQRAQIINLLCEGNSLRATSRLTSASIVTVSKLLVDVGLACDKFHNEKVMNVASKKIQCDEIWSFVYSKQKNVPNGMESTAGDVWTWVGMDENKLVLSWLIGKRDATAANLFMKDIAKRLSNRVQLTTDGLKAYLEAVEGAFGNDIDYAQLVKIYGEGDREDKRKYSPAEFIEARKTRISGNPDEKHISTSHIERQNLTMRMSMRRFTRLTNAFSKKLENHACAIALYFVHYNFCRIHKTLRVTPAMEAGLTKEIMSIEELVSLADLYKKQDSN